MTATKDSPVSSRDRKSPLHRRLVAAMRLRVWLAERFLPSSWQITLLWAAAVGLLGGLASLGFRELTTQIHWLMTGSTTGMVETFRHLPPWRRVLTPVIGALAAGLVLRAGRRFSRQGSTTDYMEAIAVGDGRLPFRSSVVKIFAAMFAIAGGESIGREGPLVQLSSVLASVVGRWRQFRVPGLRLLVGCGASAGIASAYNAPIGGAFFVAEIVLGSIAMESLGPLVVSAVGATLVVRGLGGANTLYSVPEFALHSFKEIGPYLGLGLLAGSLAPAYLRWLRFAEQVFMKLKLSLVVRLTLGGFIVGLLAWLRPEVCGNGYSTTLAVLNGSIGWELLLVILFAKAIATGASFGSGAPGGVFTPTLFTGACIGFLYSSGIHAIWSEGALDPRAFALVGMGAFLAAATHAPVMAIIVLFEMTQSYDIILPLLLAATVGYFTARSQLGESLYTEFMRRKAEADPGRQAPVISLRDLVRTAPITIPATATFSEVCDAFIAGQINHLYVIDANECFVGVVALQDVKPFLGNTDFAAGVLAMDIMRENFPTLTWESRLTEALEVFGKHEIERIPVINGAGQRKLVGTISKSDLLVALADSRQPQRSATTPHLQMQL